MGDKPPCRRLLKIEYCVVDLLLMTAYYKLERFIFSASLAYHSGPAKIGGKLFGRRFTFS
jgi:hypothetical protein